MRRASDVSPERSEGRKAAFALAQDSGMPIYAQLIVHFRQQIENGVWPVGRNIPALGILSAEYGVARETIRQAIGFLEQEGLIASRRGRGTTVLRKPEAELWYRVPESWEELVSRADGIVGTALELDAPRRLPQLPDAGDVALAAGYFAMRRLLKRNDVPYLVGTSYLDRRVVDRIGADTLGTVSVYRAMDRAGVQICSARQSLTLGTADAETAYLLEVPFNAPVVVVLRWAEDADGTLAYQSEGLFRSDFVQVQRSIR